jgi:hypothetical protein
MIQGIFFARFLPQEGTYHALSNSIFPWQTISKVSNFKKRGYLYS